MSDLYRPDDSLLTQAAKETAAVLATAFLEAADDAIDDFGLDSMYGQANPAAEAYARERAAELVTQIGDTTRTEVNALIERAIAEGWSLSDLEDALSERFTFSAERAELIARTEIGFAENGGVIASLRDADFEYVVVSDGDGDEECADADGEIWTLDEADANLLGHPNCVRSFRPATAEEIDEMDKAA